jgi:hypothetical protein
MKQESSEDCSDIEYVDIKVFNIFSTAIYYYLYLAHLIRPKFTGIEFSIE